SEQKYSCRKLHIVSVGLRGHLPAAWPVSSQHRQCLHPHTFGSTGSRTQASSARIFSMLERVCANDYSGSTNVFSRISRRQRGPSPVLPGCNPSRSELSPLPD